MTTQHSETQNVSETPNFSIVDHRYDAEHDINEFIFHASSQRAVDEWLEHMERLYAGITPDKCVRLWMDITKSGALPMGYALNRSYAWMSKLEFHPAARMAFIHKPDPFMSLADQVMRTLRLGHLRTRFFTADQKAEARAWLLEANSKK
ncbi:MAG: hypothetical protein SNJ59_12270 [Aggregatilineales bacterium]